MAKIKGFNPYHYVDRPSEFLGVGVSTHAFMRPQPLMLLDWKGGGLPVRRFLRPEQPAQVYSMPKVTDVSLRASGVYMSQATPGLLPLTDFEARRKAKQI